MTLENFGNEHWELVITPRFVRKDTSKIEVNCPHCDGTGHIQDDDGGLGFTLPKCNWCFGTGTRKVLKPIPDPPEMDPKFLKDLKEWFQNYGT
jgi:hypothetical protein